VEECQATKEGDTILGMTTWKGTTSSIRPYTITVSEVSPWLS